MSEISDDKMKELITASYIDSELQLPVEIGMSDEEVGRLIRLAFEATKNEQFSVKRSYGYIKYEHIIESGNEHLLKYMEVEKTKLIKGEKS